jgi:hypothetical protein
LLLVTVDKGRPSLWGPAPMRLRSAWDRLSRVGRAFTGDFAAAAGLNARAANSWLNRLVSLRVAVPDGSDCYSSSPTRRPRSSRVPTARSGNSPLLTVVQKKSTRCRSRAAMRICPRHPRTRRFV